jgi:nucleoside-diphosphate-sugar epimerase
VGARISLNELYHALQDIIGFRAQPSYEAPREGDVRDSLADLTQAANILGYKPLVSLTEGLERTVAWYRSQRALASGRPA